MVSIEEPIYRVNNIPVFQNKVWDTHDEAIRVSRGNVELVIDNSIGLVFNRLFNHDLMNYDENYQNEQGNSLYFLNYLNDLINKLFEFGIKDKKIIEIGCGKGLFLELLRSKGCDVIGFDPTYEGDHPYIIKEYFSKDIVNIHAEFIYLRHTLEHIPDPFLFLTEIAEANGSKGDIFIEVPTFDWIVENKAFYDIFYEHVNYFTEFSLSNMFHKSTTGRLFNGQYIYLHAALNDLKNELLEIKHLKSNYNIVFDDQIDYWHTVLKKHESVYIWGAGAKGSTFLNQIDPYIELVDSVVDINPRKQNKFIGGSGHPIISPDKIVFKNKTLIIVMNINYLEEIKTRLKNNKVSILTV